MRVYGKNEIAQSRKKSPRHIMPAHLARIRDCLFQLQELKGCRGSSRHIAATEKYGLQ